MAIFDKQRIPLGVNTSSKVDLSSNHATTTNFMQLAPFNYRHMIPGEHYKGNVSVLSRLAPVQVPCFGRCRINMRVFYVPFSFVYPNFFEFIDNTVASNYSLSSLVTETPKFYIDELWKMLSTLQYQGTYPMVTTTGASINLYDFYDGTNYYLLTEYGRKLYKILVSLGYQVSPNTKSGTSFYVSALPLLCYAKLYLDYYANRAYMNNPSYLGIERLLKFNNPSSTLTLAAQDILDILTTVSLVMYDNGNDVYINAWDSPVAPNSGTFSAQTAYDVSAISQGSSINSTSVDRVSTITNGTPQMQQNNSTATSIGTQYLHDMLHGMTDYFKRNQLSGSLAAQRFLSRYGIQLDNKSVHRSYYVCGKSVDIDFGSVMQTADTSQPGDPSNLGDYSGVGFGKGNLEIDFTAREFGMLICCYSIVPTASLYQGMDRNLLHISKEQFWTPEYDNLGCSAISKGEVYMSRSSAFTTSGLADYLGCFGFAPRYYEYKQARDFVTGDFVCDSAMQGGDAWFLNRKLVDQQFVSGVAGLVHSFAFTGASDVYQYDRIFQYTNGDIDKFYLFFHTDAMSIIPAKSLFDTYDFDDAGKFITQNGNSAVVN